VEVRGNRSRHPGARAAWEPRGEGDGRPALRGQDAAGTWRRGL